MSFPLACPRMSSSGDREGGAAATAEKKVKMTVYASCLRLPLWIPAGACPRRLLSGAGMTGLEVTRPMFVIPAKAGIAGSARDGLREKGLKAYLKTPRQDASSSSTTASVLIRAAAPSTRSGSLSNLCGIKPGHTHLPFSLPAGHSRKRKALHSALRRA